MFFKPNTFDYLASRYINLIEDITANYGIYSFILALPDTIHRTACLKDSLWFSILNNIKYTLMFHVRIVES